MVRSNQRARRDHAIFLLISTPILMVSTVILQASDGCVAIAVIRLMSKWCAAWAELSSVSAQICWWLLTLA
jgi:hypothetical protein